MTVPDPTASPLEFLAGQLDGAELDIDHESADAATDPRPLTEQEMNASA